MARLTVEDCLKYVDNRFDLSLKAAKRARELERGAEPLVKWENDKPTVVALREIAENKIIPEEVVPEEASYEELEEEGEIEEVVTENVLPEEPPE